MQLLGKLDDQDGVLGRQTDDGDHAELEVDVVLKPAPLGGQDDTEHAQRHHQQHRQRNGPAFIQRGQAQEDGQQREGVQDVDLRAGALLLEGDAGPLVAVALGQFGHQLLDLGHHVTGTDARQRREFQPDGRVAVVADGLHRAHRPAHAGKGREGHDRARGVQHVQLQDVLGLHAVLGIGLHHDALQTSLVGEVVHVGGAHHRGQRAADGRKRHAQGIGLLAVDVDLQLRSVIQTVHPHHGEHAALHGQARELLARLHQGVVALAGAVLQSQRRTAGVAQLGNGRRRQRVDEGIADARQCHLGPLGQGSGRVLFTLALVPVLQRHEGDGRVLAVAAEREAQHADGVLDLGLRHHELLDLLHGIQRALLRGTGRQLDVHHDVALVLVGQEARGDAHEEEGRDTDDDAIEQHPPGRTPDDAGHAAFIALGRAGKAAVEPAEEAALGMMVAGLDRLQERGAQRRRERQRQEGREADGGGHDRRELAVDVAHRAAE